MDAKQLLGPAITADYMPHGYWGMFMFARNRPVFSGSVLWSLAYQGTNPFKCQI